MAQTTIKAQIIDLELKQKQQMLSLAEVGLEKSTMRIESLEAYQERLFDAVGKVLSRPEGAELIHALTELQKVILHSDLSPEKKHRAQSLSVELKSHVETPDGKRKDKSVIGETVNELETLVGSSEKAVGLWKRIVKLAGTIYGLAG